MSSTRLSPNGVTAPSPSSRRIGGDSGSGGHGAAARMPSEAQRADAHKPRRRRYWPLDADALAERLVKPQPGVGGRPDGVRLPLPDVFRSPSSKRMRHASKRGEL